MTEAVFGSKTKTYHERVFAYRIQLSAPHGRSSLRECCILTSLFRRGMSLLSTCSRLDLVKEPMPRCRKTTPGLAPRRRQAKCVSLWHMKSSEHLGSRDASQTHLPGWRSDMHALDCFSADQSASLRWVVERKIPKGIGISRSAGATLSHGRGGHEIAKDAPWHIPAASSSKHVCTRVL